MRRALGLVALCAGAALLGGCWHSEDAHSGIGEPIMVRNGQFFEGAFPANSGGPGIDQPVVQNKNVTAGFVNKKVTGYSGPGSTAVAVALQGFGTGYWVVPVGAPEQLFPGDFDWEADCDFSRALPTSDVLLQMAATDIDGHFGQTTRQPLSLDSFVPAGHVVASLTWGNDSDLDLHIVAPSGKELYPKQINTGGVYTADDPDAGAKAGDPLPGVGQLDRDSNGGCVIDGYREEDAVWKDAPEVGTYIVRVDMFESCGQPASNFSFKLYVDGQVVLTKSGRLLDLDADRGGPGSGLFIGQFTCEGSGTCS